jgi:hypothetical protein
MNLICSAFLIISTIFSSTIGFPISIENGPAIVVKQHKPIIYSPENETIIKPIILPPAPPSPLDEINDIMPAKYITIDGIIIYTPKDASPFII